MIKISIIIPVYNVEKYIHRCLESCVNQNLEVSDFEIIIVNDGSLDRSLDVALNFAKTHKNIKIITQPNQGLSIARNEGLKIAKGEYIWFVDSDDWIENNCILELYITSKDNNLDVLLFDAYDCNNNNYKKRNTIQTNSREIQIGLNYLDYGKIVFPVCFKIFKRNFLISNSIFFYENIFHEDNEFTPRMFFYAKRVMCINKSFYYVYKNPQSITRSVNKKKAFDLILIANSYIDFIEENILGNEIKIKFYNLIGLVLNSSLAEIFFMNKSEKTFFFKYLKKNQNLFYCLKKSSVMKYKIEGFLFMISSSLFFKIYSRFYFVFYKKIV